MRVVNLIENTKGPAGCEAEHGLCLYVETRRHRLLMDAGASALFLQNARMKGVDLSQVDVAVLSHGHYDHGGGLPAFAGVNPGAPIYLQESALLDYDSLSGGAHYIGLPGEAKRLSRLCPIDGDYEIDEELSLFARIPAERPLPPANRALKARAGEALVQDDFRHEQCLAVRQDGVSALFSGCAHHGILNILSAYRSRFGRDPDYVFSGFHLMKKDGYDREDIEEIDQTARALARCETTFYTGHCTGLEPYARMKEIMGERLHYMHCGDEIVIGPRADPAAQNKGTRED